MHARRHSLALLAATLLFAASAGAQGFRDPMRPAGATPAAAPRASAPSSLRLEGVIAGATRVAIVNGRLVRAGDTIAGAIIVEVLHDGVRYSRAGRIQTLVLPQARPVPGVRVARSSEPIKPKADRP